jgi:hypothetical protein
MQVMVARVAAASKCREKCKKPEKPIFVGIPKETPPSYVPLYPLPSAPLHPPSEGEAASDGGGPSSTYAYKAGRRSP